MWSPTGAVTPEPSSSTAPGSPNRCPSPTTTAGATVEVGGKVIEVLDGGRVKVELTATCDGVKVLGMARAVVQLA